MAEETIFKEAEGSIDNTPEETKPQAQETILPDEVKELIGEGKKYASVEEALKALRFSQEHISTIERENADMREKLHSAESIQEMLDKKRGNDSSFDISKIDEVIDQKLSAREKQNVMTSNIQTVDSQMKTMFGEKAVEVLRNKSSELGVSVDHMMSTAATSPKAFMSWFTSSKEASKSDGFSTSVNTDNNAFSDSQNKSKPFTYNYYNEMRRSNPSEYWKPQIQKEMHDKMLATGEDFYA